MCLQTSWPRHRLVAACLVYLILILGPVAPATAKPAHLHYQISDGAEGDPGDGVLKPGPVLEPGPIPVKTRIPEIVAVYMERRPDGTIRPVIILRDIPTGFRWLDEGRCHRAP